MFRKRPARKALGLAILVVGVGATAAYAYQERTVTARLTTPSNTGCIQLSSALNHGDASAPMQMVISATLPGRTRNSADTRVCNNDWPRGTTARLSGEPVGYIIKLLSQGAQHDDYFLCAGGAFGAQSSVSELTLDFSYPTPPCGAGHYALIACLRSVTTTASRLFTPTIRGSFNSNDLTTDCNVSPNWHPAGVGDSITPIGPVRL